MKKFNIFPYVFVFLATYLVLQLWQGSSAVDPILSSGDVGLKTSASEYAIGKDIRVEVQNNGSEAIEIGVTCMHSDESDLIEPPFGDFLLPPFNVYRYTSEEFVPVLGTEHPDCETGQAVSIDPGKTKTISLLPFSYSYFGEVGRYKLALSVGDQSFETPEFQIVEPGMFTTLWRTIVYQPMLNVLVALLIYIPGHYLGLAVILLTIIIRTILLVPSQKAMKAQRRMQEIQPKLEEIKKKYADDQARIAQETMLLWKTNKVSPFSSCLPILFQLPILIALFNVVNTGLSPDQGIFIYQFLPEFSFHDINASFLGFDLLQKDLIIFPLVIGVLQFIQMQLMMSKKKKTGDSKLPQEVETANKMMKYVMPVMIAVFTTQVPSAVGLYWGTSTFYGIIQQLVVNKEGSKPSSSDDDVQIRVINRK